MKLSLILEAVDRMTAPARKAAAGVRAIGEAAQPATRGVAALSRATKAAGSDATSFARGAGRAAMQAERLGDQARPAARAIGELDRQLTRVSASTFKWTRLALRSADAVDRVTDRVRSLARAGALSVKWAGLKSLEMSARAAGGATSYAAGKLKDLMLGAARWGVLGGAAIGGWLVTGTIGIGSQFEQFQAQLEGTEGSVAKAKAALAWVAKFARNTPYELAEVTDAFARARGVGIDPMNGAMRSMGDAASGARKDLMSAVEALADAQTGEFERLKEFNITTSVQGDKATFSFINKAGKEARISVSKDMTSIRNAVLSIFDEKYGGSMIRRSRTFEGIWSNIKDKLANIQLRIANAGLFDYVKAKLQGILDWLDKLEKTGALDRWAKQVSDNLKRAFEWGEAFAKSIDWNAVAAGIGAIATVAARTAEAIGKAATAMREWRYESARRFLDGQMNGWFTSDEQRGRIRQQIDQLDRDFGKKAVRNVPQLRSGVAGERTGRLDRSGWTQAVTARPKLAPAMSRPATRPPMKPASQPAPKGKLEISVKTTPGASAKVTRVAATGMDVQVNTGRAMGAFA